MAVDKNLPAMLDEKAYTIHVIENQYASAYKHNARRQFADAVLAQLPADARNGITALLKGE